MPAGHIDPKSIGVAISGGGHRATAYGLGVLLYLVDSRLNQRVGTISSVSGGSILNAFVALLPVNGITRKSFSSFDGFGTFDADAARLARLLAGSRAIWSGCVAVALLVEMVVLAAFFLDLINGVTALLSVATLVLVLSTAIGPRSGGSLWGWWGTWLYCGAIMWLVTATAIVAASTQFSMTSLIVGGVLCGWLAQQRHRIAGQAYDQTICSPPTWAGCLSMKQARLEDMDKDVRHVFCATEMHSGKHAYFSHDVVYARGFGLGKPAGLPVATAVQASANFPGGFPVRALSADRFEFSVTDRFEDAVEEGIKMGRDILMPDEDFAWATANHDFPKARPLPDWLLLSDGGVFDNLAVDWFLDNEARRSRFLADLNWDWDGKTQSWIDHDTNPRDPAILDALQDSSDALIVVNAGVTVHWQGSSSINMALPILGEVIGLSRISSTMYNNNTKERIRALQEHMVVEIGYKERLVSTTLLPLGIAVTTALVTAGYHHAMREAMRRFGHPQLSVKPEDFEALARGQHGKRTKKLFELGGSTDLSSFRPQPFGESEHTG